MTDEIFENQDTIIIDKTANDGSMKGRFVKNQIKTSRQLGLGLDWV